MAQGNGVLCGALPALFCAVHLVTAAHRVRMTRRTARRPARVLLPRRVPFAPFTHAALHCYPAACALQLPAVRCAVLCRFNPQTTTCRLPLPPHAALLHAHGDRRLRDQAVPHLRAHYMTKRGGPYCHSVLHRTYLIAIRTIHRRGGILRRYLPTCRPRGWFYHRAAPPLPAFVCHFPLLPVTVTVLTFYLLYVHAAPLGFLPLHLPCLVC